MTVYLDWRWNSCLGLNGCQLLSLCIFHVVYNFSIAWRSRHCFKEDAGVGSHLACRRIYLLHPAGPPWCWQMECHEQLPLASQSHVLCTGCCLQQGPACSPAATCSCCCCRHPTIYCPCLQWGWAHPGCFISLLLWTSLTLCVFISCWYRWYQEILNLPGLNLSHSSDGFHFSTSQIQISYVTGHNWGKNI